MSTSQQYDMSGSEKQPEESSHDRRVRTKRIGKQLREFYDEVTSEGIPDDFLKLLEEAEEKARGGAKRSDTSGSDPEPRS